MAIRTVNFGSGTNWADGNVLSDIDLNHSLGVLSGRNRYRFFDDMFYSYMGSKAGDYQRHGPYDLIWSWDGTATAPWISGIAVNNAGVVRIHNGARAGNKIGFGFLAQQFNPGSGFYVELRIRPDCVGAEIPFLKMAANTAADTTTLGSNYLRIFNETNGSLVLELGSNNAANTLYSSSNMTASTWYTLGLEVTSTLVRVYLNDTLVTSGTTIPAEQLNYLHVVDTTTADEYYDIDYILITGSRT